VKVADFARIPDTLSFMRPRKTDAHSEYRILQTQRVSDSPSLQDNFPQLKSLSLDLGQYDPEGASRVSQLKYSVNLQHARALFRINCANRDCVRGDFDLSDAITRAIAERRVAVSGELCCQGWLSKATIDSVRCHNLLRFKLNLEYV
jgi:hypothetical protein